MAVSGTKFRKVDRMCVVCGKTFKGTEAAQSCSPSCRVKLSRLKAANRKPEFMLLAKSKGQKTPDLNAPKGVKLKKGETLRFPAPKPKQEKQEIIADKIEYTTSTQDSYDGERLSPIIQDEARKTEPPLTVDQKLKIKENLEEEIKFWQNRPCQGHPKMWATRRDAAIQELQDKIKLLL